MPEFSRLWLISMLFPFTSASYSLKMWSQNNKQPRYSYFELVDKNTPQMRSHFAWITSHSCHSLAMYFASVASSSSVCHHCFCCCCSSTSPGSYCHYIWDGGHRISGQWQVLQLTLSHSCICKVKIKSSCCCCSIRFHFRAEDQPNHLILHCSFMLTRQTNPKGCMFWRITSIILCLSFSTVFFRLVRDNCGICLHKKCTRFLSLPCPRRFPL